MTEDEARRKWCPMVRWIGTTDERLRTVISNRGEVKSAASRIRDYCIASDCMMWRWSPEYVREKNATSNSDMVASGYCGLGSNLCDTNLTHKFRAGGKECVFIR